MGVNRVNICPNCKIDFYDDLGDFCPKCGNRLVKTQYTDLFWNKLSDKEKKNYVEEVCLHKDLNEKKHEPSAKDNSLYVNKPNKKEDSELISNKKGEELVAVFCSENENIENDSQVKTPARENNSNNSIYAKKPELNQLKNRANSARSNDESQMPFYFQMWFISLVFWLGAFVYGLGIAAAVILIIFRSERYPSKRKDTLLATIPQIVAFAIIIFLVVFFDGKDARELNKYIDAQDYDSATQYVNNHINKDSFSYYSWMERIYAAQGKYDEAAMYIVDYYNNSEDILATDDDAEAKLQKYTKEDSEYNLSSETTDSLNNIVINLEKAKKQKEEQEKAAIEAAEQAKVEKEEKKQTEKIAKEAAKKEEAERKEAEKKEAKVTQENSSINKEVESNEVSNERKTEDSPEYISAANIDSLVIGNTYVFTGELSYSPHNKKQKKNALYSFNYFNTSDGSVKSFRVADVTKKNKNADGAFSFLDGHDGHGVIVTDDSIFCKVTGTFDGIEAIKSVETDTILSYHYQFSGTKVEIIPTDPNYDYVSKRFVTDYRYNDWLRNVSVNDEVVYSGTIDYIFAGELYGVNTGFMNVNIGDNKTIVTVLNITELNKLLVGDKVQVTGIYSERDTYNTPVVKANSVILQQKVK